MRVFQVLSSAVFAALLVASGSASYGGCTDGITCAKVAANGLVFDCRFGGPDVNNSVGNVMMLHGFPEWSDMYMPLMRTLAAKGYHSVACNQRGYSPGAAPSNVTAYDYNLLKDDVFAVAKAVNFTAEGRKFHLVGHDHGGVLGWVSTASPEGQASLLSYSSLSIPHVDAFSAGLQGPAADLPQQIASQYFTMFILPDSASLHGGVFYYTLAKTSGDSNSGTFGSKAAFQKAMWWYNGAFAASIMSAPPLMSASSLLSHGSVSMAALRGLFGGTPNNGTAAAHPIGKISTPALYVCGKSDSAILCNRPYALATKDHVTGPYTYLEVDCGHGVLSCSKSGETDKVISGIVAHVMANN